MKALASVAMCGLMMWLASPAFASVCQWNEIDTWTCAAAGDKEDPEASLGSGLIILEDNGIAHESNLSWGSESLQRLTSPPSAREWLNALPAPPEPEYDIPATPNVISFQVKRHDGNAPRFDPRFYPGLVVPVCAFFTRSGYVISPCNADPPVDESPLAVR